MQLFGFHFFLVFFYENLRCKCILSKKKKNEIISFYCWLTVCILLNITLQLFVHNDCGASTKSICISESFLISYFYAILFSRMLVRVKEKVRKNIFIFIYFNFIYRLSIFNSLTIFGCRTVCVDRHNAIDKSCRKLFAQVYYMRGYFMGF